MIEPTASAPSVPATAPVSASAPSAVPVPLGVPATAPPAQPSEIPSLSEIQARSIAAGAKAAAEAKAKASESVPVPPVPAPEAVTEDAGVPEPPAATEPAVEPEAKSDPLAAMAARFDALEKQNAALIEHIGKLTAKPMDAPKPDPEKPAAKPTKVLTNSPFEAQARVYFGDDLPKPLMVDATDVLSKRHGWQAELHAAETAVAAGDAAAAARITKAQAALARAQEQLDRIEHDATIASALAASQKPVAQAWGVMAREEFVDSVLSTSAADRKDWGDVAALPDHEIALVMRAVPAGTNEADYAKRASEMLQTYAASKKATQTISPKPAEQPKQSAAPKNPAPLAPPKVETPTAGPPWPTDRVMSFHEIQQQVIARARGDRTN